ncbi:MAG: response regulator [Planctomycetota bacterium]
MNSATPALPAASGPQPPQGVPALRCVLVEDQAMFRELVEKMLEIRGGLRVVGRASTVAEGITVCAAQSPDLLLLDLALPDGDGIEVARQFLRGNPSGTVIIITGHKSSFVCPAWLDGNLRAIISKNDTFQALRAELDDLLGRVPPVAERTAGGPAATPLTRREAEVFALVGQGLSSQQIAERLRVSVHTVLTHRKRIAKKLGTRGMELVARAAAQRAAFFGPGGEPR